MIELERLATAVWITRHEHKADIEQRARELIRVKPRVALDKAVTALEEIDDMRSEAASTVL